MSKDVHAQSAQPESAFQDQQLKQAMEIFHQLPEDQQKEILAELNKDSIDESSALLPSPAMLEEYGNINPRLPEAIAHIAASTLEAKIDDREQQLACYK